MTTTPNFPDDLPRTAWLHACAPLLFAVCCAQVHAADDGALLGAQRDGAAALELRHAGGWTAGTVAADAGERLTRHGASDWTAYGGYRGTLGPLGWSALAERTRHVDGGAFAGAYDNTMLVAGIDWKSLYARYHYAVGGEYFGIPDARGSGYLDVGARHAFGRALTLNLHAGDGHVAGSGNTAWNWRDMKAGLTHRLEDGWLMSLNYTRALGANGAYDRNAVGVPRPGGPLGPFGMARRALVLSVSRKF